MYQRILELNWKAVLTAGSASKKDKLLAMQVKTSIYNIKLAREDENKLVRSV